MIIIAMNRSILRTLSCTPHLFEKRIPRFRIGSGVPCACTRLNLSNWGQTDAAKMGGKPASDAASHRVIVSLSDTKKGRGRVAAGPRCLCPTVTRGDELG